LFCPLFLNIHLLIPQSLLHTVVDLLDGAHLEEQRHLGQVQVAFALLVGQRLCGRQQGLQVLEQLVHGQVQEVKGPHQIL